MKKIVIIAFTVIGPRCVRVGDSWGFPVSNPFKKQFSRKLKKELISQCKINNLDCSIEIDQSYDEPNQILLDSADLILISPLIKKYIDVSDLDSSTYYHISEDDYLHAKTENIIKVIKNLCEK